MVIYDNVEIFENGPCELVVQSRGLLVVPSLRLGGSDGRLVNVGPQDLVIVARGLMIGASATQVWSVYDALVGLVSEPPRVATLVDDAGREWETMSLVSVTTTGPMQTGRVKSVAVEATFVRFGT